MDQNYTVLFAFTFIWYSVEPLRLSRASLRASQTEVFPAWLFSLAWFIIYGLNAGATFVYWRDGTANTTVYGATLTVFLLNLVIVKTWMPLIASKFSEWLAAGAAVAALITAIVVEVLIVSDIGATLAFGLFLPYIGWLLVITGLSVYTAMHTKKRSQESPPLERRPVVLEPPRSPSLRYRLN